MLELAEARAKEAKIDVKFFKNETDNLQFKDNFFDAAIFIAVLHCIETEEKRKKSLKELFRVLKPGAEAIITVWDKDQERFKNSPKENKIPWTKDEKKYLRYYYLYEKEEITTLIKNTGFEITKVYNQEAQPLNYSKKNIILIIKKP